MADKEHEETDAEAVKRLEHEMEDTLHKMEDEDEHLKEGDRKAQENWDDARRDPGVPGAEPIEDEERGGQSIGDSDEADPASEAGQ
jgi:hypothetical protein